jgi:phosphoglycerol transferase
MVTKSVLKHGWWLENPDLGAPFGQQLYDFPVLVGDSLHLALIKLLGVFYSDPVLVLNLFFLLSFPLVALVSFVVLRQLGISSAVALVCSVLYALAPYHFVRGEFHLWLAAYYSVPVGAYLVLSLLSGRALFTKRARTGGPRLLAWASKRSLVTLILCLVVACAGTVYYAAFTGMLLVAVMVLILVTRRDIRGLIQGGIVVGLIVGFLLLSSLPNLMYEFQNGPNNEAAVRPVTESEEKGLRLITMVFPAPGHQVDAIADFAENFYNGDGKNLTKGEGPNQSLGLIATLGFLWLLLVALAGCLSPRWQIGRLEQHRQLATATVIAFLIGTVGGISLVFAYLVSPEIRAWNRISIFIAFFAIAAIALLLEALQERIRVRRGGPVLVGIVLSSVLLIGLYDQSGKHASVPNYSSAKDRYSNDAAFVSAIDDELPSQAQVFQLPYVPFPEGSAPNEMKDYDLLRPYLHDNDLRWSFGAVKGRPEAEWQADLADKPTEDLVDTVIAKGFDGVYIDRQGYPDRAAELEGELDDLLKVEPVVSPSGDKSFFSLLPYKEHL